MWWVAFTHAVLHWEWVYYPFAGYWKLRRVRTTPTGERYVKCYGIQWESERKWKWLTPRLDFGKKDELR